MKRGASLVELLIGIAVFTLLSVAIYQGFVAILNAVQVSRFRILATNLGNEELEIIHNLSYANVGTSGGIPNGVIPAAQNLVREGITFSVKTTIRNIDDPFDGTIGGTPNDLSPADYKLVEVDVSCTTCMNMQTLEFTSRIAPKNLENSSTNGALFVKVFDANGQPITGASVHVENTTVSPAIIIDDVTDSNGILQLVDVPPGVEAYKIVVTKSGYSTDQTYQTGAPGNPFPIKPYATVATQQLTQISFTIDSLSSLSVSTLTQICTPVGSLNFSLSGSKLIGTPNILKYNQNYTTDGSGNKTIPGLEWDNYALAFSSNSYDLAGSIPLVPLNLAPNATQDLKLIVIPKIPSSLLVLVKDSGNGLPLSQASVTLQDSSGAARTLVTGKGSLVQTDWSGGAGQTDYIDQTKFFDSDGNVDIDNPAGVLTLKNTLGQYASSGVVTSSTFDTGSPSNFYTIAWQPTDQPSQTGPDAVKLQLAANNDNATWNFLGPDGTNATYYTLANSTINAIANGQRYVRYKLFLNTASTQYTPTVSDISFTFTSACVPPGQVLFQGLASGDYTATINRSGYAQVVQGVAISNSWQQLEIPLSP